MTLEERARKMLETGLNKFGITMAPDSAEYRICLQNYMFVLQENDRRLSKLRYYATQKEYDEAMRPETDAEVKKRFQAFLKDHTSLPDSDFYWLE